MPRALWKRGRPRSAGAVEREHPLEVGEKLRQPHPQEVVRPPPGCRLLLLVRVAITERVVSVKGLEVEIEDGELQLMGPKPSRLIRRREFQALAEEEKNVRRLRDQPLPHLQDRRCEGRSRDAAGGEDLENRWHAPGLRQDRHVVVVRTGFLECQADELTASLDAGPVIELVGHQRAVCASRSGRRSGARPCGGVSRGVAGSSATRPGSGRRDPAGC